MAAQLNNQEMFPTDDNGSESSILKIALIRQIIKGLMPELLDPNDGSEAILRKIKAYLFDQPRLASSELETLVNEELCVALYGLKVLLKEHSVTSVSLAMDTSKQLFLDYVNQQQEEE